MSIFDNLQKSFTSLSKETKKVFDSTKIQLRIKGYSDEADDIFMEIGKMLYENREDMSDKTQERINELFDNIDNINHRISGLEKTLTDIRKTESKEKENIVVAAGSKNYAKLSKKEDDFKTVRTNEGIFLLRHCPECAHESKLCDTQCSNCGYEFKKNKDNELLGD